MQQHLNGFRPGDPDLAPAEPAGEDLPEQVDVLVVGSGPAGLVLAAQLTRFPHLTVRVVERRDGPLELGQADGVACRTVEMFEAFGLSDRLLREACWITETVFWAPDGPDGTGLVRTGRIQDVEEGLSEFPHLILNQARVQDLLLESMQKSASRLRPDYGLELVDLAVDKGGEHPVSVTLRPTGIDDESRHRTVRARYVVGCDGARSTVREQIGRHLRGDAANQAWGVMDVLAVTDFPDIRRKAVIKSEHGNLLLIPREGGYLVRMYVEMDHLDPGERVRARQLGLDDVIARARQVLRPHELDVKEVAWWSVYEVGQRLTDRFDDLSDDAPADRQPRVFVAGDACHTHSPKAGQGMNVSMQDGFNLAWKLGAVLQGRSHPDLLRTYSLERQDVASELIEFDRRFAASMAARPGTAGSSTFEEQFELQGRYTAGVATRYPPGLLTGPHTWQHLATGFGIGTRFHSAPVTRLADSRPMHLGHVHEADGRWRLYAFADRADVREPGSRLRGLCDVLADPARSPVLRHTPHGADPDTVIDVRAVLQQGHREVDPTDLPPALRPTKGAYGLDDYEKVFTPADGADEGDVFDIRGVDRDSGALVLVRPDQYIAHVVPLDDTAPLDDLLGAFMHVPV